MALRARTAIDAVREPMRDFLKANASETERARFFEVAAARAAREHGPASETGEVGADDLTVLVPAFVVTELGEAFAIGFLIYLPFLVIDLVVSNVLLALGHADAEPDAGEPAVQAAPVRGDRRLGPARPCARDGLPVRPAVRGPRRADGAGLRGLTSEPPAYLPRLLRPDAVPWRARRCRISGQ